MATPDLRVDPLVEPVINEVRHISQVPVLLVRGHPEADAKRDEAATQRQKP